MSAYTLEAAPPDHPDSELDFCVIIDAPHLTIVYADGRFRGRVNSNPIAAAVMLEVARGHGLIVDEVVNPGWGELEITFRECGTT